jgi:single-stranded-DNA-specific exonuclease
MELIEKSSRSSEERASLAWKALPWHVKAASPEAVGALSRSLGLHSAIARVLCARGIENPQAAKRFLNPTLREGLPHPYMIKGMREAAHAILEAIRENRKICVWGDYDVDGTTGTSALTLFLREIGSCVRVYVPHRIEEGYGLNQNAIRVLAEEGVKLLITVDCGISNSHEILLAKELGISTIVVDHHLVPEPRPSALAILNPHQPDCQFPAKELSGAGLAFYLLLGLRVASKERDQALPTPDPRPYLDIISLGTIADMVPLNGVNRVLVKRGLTELTHTTRPGLVALKEVSGLAHRSLRAGHVGFQLGPRINAAGRVSVGARVVELLTTDCQETARSLAQELDENNRTRQRIEMEVFNQAMASAEEAISASSAIALGSPAWHPGVLGIVCSRLLERFHRPTVLVGFSDGLGKGSARSVPGLSIVDALRHCEDLLERYGGHEMAGGLTIQQELFPRFVEKFSSYVRSVLPSGPITHPLVIDAMLSFQDIQPKLIKELETLSPFGIGNPEPIFATRAVEILEHREVGEGHLKLKLFHDDQKMEAIGFRMSKPAWLVPKGFADIAYRITVDEFGGNERLQLKLLDMQPAGRT